MSDSPTTMPALSAARTWDMTPRRHEQRARMSRIFCEHFLSCSESERTGSESTGSESTGSESIMKRLFLLLLLAAAPLFAQYTPATPGQNDAVEPFRIIGNIYYVGANEVTSYLITSPEGDILLDGGFPETAPLIERNIQKLGFKLTDVKTLISTHAHYDHAGGLAELKRVTGATFYASAADTPLLAAGGKGDFAFGDRFLFPPVKADRVVEDNQVIRVGTAAMHAHLTPGHTKGCTTWTADVIENGEKHTAVFICSISMPGGYKLVNNTKYPKIAEDYKQT